MAERIRGFGGTSNEAPVEGVLHLTPKGGFDFAELSMTPAAAVFGRCAVLIVTDLSKSAEEFRQELTSGIFVSDNASNWSNLLWHQWDAGVDFVERLLESNQTELEKFQNWCDAVRESVAAS